jgi:hypothetical protein
MRNQSLIVLAIATICAGACAKRVPEPAGVARGTPHISWIIMSGDRDNPDQEFVCQSGPRNDCVVPVSRPDAQVFSDVHIYYHGAGMDTRYTGSIQIGFFRGSPESHNIQTSVAVQKTESITNQSVSGIVSSTPGTYAVTFALVATATDTGKSQPIREQVPVVVK